MTTSATASDDATIPLAPAVRSIRFRSCEEVREVLVLQALSATMEHFGADLQEALDRAFPSVVARIRDGRIALDYAPDAAGLVDIPPRAHPLYAQALFYWCGQFRCDLHQLVEAHARLGTNPTRAQVIAALSCIEREEQMSETDVLTTCPPGRMRAYDAMHVDRLGLGLQRALHA